MLSRFSPDSASGARSSSSSSTRSRYLHPVRGNPRLTQIGRLLAAVSLVLGAGTIGFHSILAESWFQSFYRTVVTATLTGLDTVPSSDGARALSIVMVLAGLTIIAYVGAVIVEVIASGV